MLRAHADHLLFYEKNRFISQNIYFIPDAERAKRAERQDLQIRAIRLYYNNGKGISLVRSFCKRIDPKNAPSGTKLGT